MTSKASRAFAIAVMICGLVSVGLVHSGAAQASSSVSGIMNSDAVWTKANSPYKLTGPILVSEGITLTIEPGVAVNLSSHYIRVAGTLRACGSGAEPIRFTGGSNTPDWSISFMPTSPSWNERTRTGCIMENTVIDSIHTGISVRGANPMITKNSISAFYAIDVYDCSPMISDNIINGQIGLHDGNVTMTNNTIRGKILGFSNVGLVVISNNTVIGYGQDINDAGIMCSNAYVVGNTVLGFAGAGIVLNGNATIEKNLIMNNRRGLQISSGDENALIRYNTIFNNSVGIETNNSPVRIVYNNILNNSEYGVYHLGGVSIDVVNNWWGTTDTQVISQKICDFKNDFNLGKVTFEPFLTAPNPNAPAAQTQPSPTPEPEPLPSPSPLPSPDEPDDQPQPETGLSGIETAIIIALVAIVIVQAVTLGLVLRKKRPQSLQAGS